MVKNAVVAWMAGVNPRAAEWAGWDGKCPGVKVDADRFWRLMSWVGRVGCGRWLAVTGSEATRARWKTRVRTALRGARAGELVVLFYSGHGGQVRDLNGDEPDGLDETLCLWDGNLVDDDIRELFCDKKVELGVKVFFCTDCCNSGSPFRSRRLEIKVSDGFSMVRRKPLWFMRLMEPDLRVNVLHFGGCGDGESAMGSERGGAFTSALAKVFAPTMSYVELWNSTVSIMRKNRDLQIPSFSMSNAVGPDPKPWDCEVFS